MGILSKRRNMQVRVKGTSTATQLHDGDGKFIQGERQRLAQEIHDGLIQELTAAVLQLEICEKVYAKDSSQVLAPLTRAKKQARKCLNQLRQLTFDLRLTAVKELGLVKALHRHCDELSQEKGIAIAFNATKAQVELPLSIAGSMYYIVREALLNASKHAMARLIQVNVSFDEQHVMVIVEDDGNGFEVEPTLANAEEEKKFGLVGMHERAHLLDGSLHVQSAPHSGTRVTAVIPYAPDWSTAK